jgi:hypothetical protein
MSAFTESSAFEQMSLNAVSELGDKPSVMVRKDMLSYRKQSLGYELHPARRAIRAKVAGLKEPVTQ